jgi:hypothetical protein
MHSPQFDIREGRQDGHVRLSLEGELDMASTPMLEDRLIRLRAKKQDASIYRSSSSSTAPDCAC